MFIPQRYNSKEELSVTRKAAYMSLKTAAVLAKQCRTVAASLTNITRKLIMPCTHASTHPLRQQAELGTYGCE
jgi:hypothetical protein